jgi:hypothetical protein
MSKSERALKAFLVAVDSERLVFDSCQPRTESPISALLHYERHLEQILAELAKHSSVCES